MNWDFLKNFLDGLKTAFFRLIILWWFLIGLACIWASVLIAHDHELRSKFLEATGIALLVGGVFETVVKSMESMGLFKQQLKKVLEDDNYIKKQREIVAGILHSPEFSARQANVLSSVIYEAQFLKDRKDIDEVWKRVTTALYQSKFPHISDKIADKIFLEFFPVDDNFYYHAFNESVEIHFKDNKYITSEETLNLILRPVDESKKVTWGYWGEMYKTPSDTVTCYELKTLIVNKVDKIKTGECLLRKNDPVDVKSFEIGFSIDLEGAKEYEIKMVQKKVWDIDIDNTKIFTAMHFVNTPELLVQHDLNLEVKFYPMGTREDAYESKSQIRNLIHNVYHDLIFPNQGYRLELRRR